MKYNELKEMKINEWDGNPFYAIVIDNDDQTLFASDKRRYAGKMKGVLVTGYNCGRWCDNNCTPWEHVYPIEWNKKPKKRMTHRQLAMWLAKGNGEWTNDTLIACHSSCTYDKTESNDFVGEDFRVRKWDSEEWIEPTTDLLEDCE